MARRLHKVWLRVAAVIVGGFGPFLTLATFGVVEPARWSLDLLSWPVDGATRLADADTLFLSALTGGFLVGWGVTIWALSGRAHDLAPEPVRRAVVTGLCCWCAFDRLGSWASGNSPNTLFNLLVLASAVGPMWRPAREDRRPPP